MKEDEEGSFDSIFLALLRLGAISNVMSEGLTVSNFSRRRIKCSSSSSSFFSKVAFSLTDSGNGDGIDDSGGSGGEGVTDVVGGETASAAVAAGAAIAAGMPSSRGSIDDGHAS